MTDHAVETPPIIVVQVQSLSETQLLEALANAKRDARTWEITARHAAKSIQVLTQIIERNRKRSNN
jgi:hypothetical protein